MRQRGGGTGGNGTGGTGGGDGGDFDASLNAFCMNVAPCYGLTAQECIDYYNNDLPNIYNVDGELRSSAHQLF